MKLAETWWRVSTEDQREVSPDTQTGAAMALAEQEGYHVPPEKIIRTDWGSLSVWGSRHLSKMGPDECRRLLLLLRKTKLVLAKKGNY